MLPLPPHITELVNGQEGAAGEVATSLLLQPSESEPAPSREDRESQRTSSGRTAQTI